MILISPIHITDTQRDVTWKRKKIRNWKDWLTVGMSHVMLPSVLCISKYTWLKLYLFFRNPYPFYNSSLYEGRAPAMAQVALFEKPRSKAWRKSTNKMQQYRWFIVNSGVDYWLVSTCFGHLYAHHQEKRPRVTAYRVYLLVVLDVAVLVGPCHHGMPRPQVANRGTASDKEGSCE